LGIKFFPDEMKKKQDELHKTRCEDLTPLPLSPEKGEGELPEVLYFEMRIIKINNHNLTPLPPSPEKGEGEVCTSFRC
jgi:hypothetical protein